MKYLGIVEMDLERLFEMPTKDVKSAYEAAKKARNKLNEILKEFAGRLG